MTLVYPDLNWYAEKSKAGKVTSHCPYANVHRCPRYYHSLYLLSDVGITTKIDNDKRNELDAYWSKTDILPVVGEHDVAISGANDKHLSFINFCPEISYDIFGLFASSLHKYYDEIDMAAAYNKLEKEGNAESQDWRWRWNSISPLHYLECPFYAQLFVPPRSVAHEATKTPSSIMELKPGMWGINLNLKVLLTRFAEWWLSKEHK